MRRCQIDGRSAFATALPLVVPAPYSATGLSRAGLASAPGPEGRAEGVGWWWLVQLLLQMKLVTAWLHRERARRKAIANCVVSTAAV